MRKSSLGRRRSSAVNQVRMGPTGCDSTRKSGIPVRSKTQESMGLQSAAKSAYSAMTPSSVGFHLSQNLPSGGLRPPRSMTMTGDSSRMSSLSGSKTKKDIRPLMDKEWQLEAERFICSYFAEDPAAVNIIPSTSVRLGPMNLNLFIDMVNFLLKKLDSTCEINKVNYITEVPFLLKKMLYRGKVDKSLLQTVSAMHAWPHVLGILHFLVECVKNEENTDKDYLLFPDEFDEPDEEEENGRDPKAMLDFFIQLHDHHQRGRPNFEELLDQRLEAYVHQAFPDEELERNTLDKEVNELNNKKMLMRKEISQTNLEAEEMNSFLNEITNNISSLSDFKQRHENYISQLEPVIQDERKRRQAIVDNINKLKSKRETVLNSFQVDNISIDDVNTLLKRRSSLEQSIKSESQRSENLREIFFQEDLEVTRQTKMLCEMMRNWEVLVAKYMNEPGIESLKIEGESPKDINEALLTGLKMKILPLKNEVSNSVGDVSRQAKHDSQDMELMKKEVDDVQQLLLEKNDEYDKAYEEKRESNQKRKNEIEALKKRIHELDEKIECSEKRCEDLRSWIDVLETDNEKNKEELEQLKKKHSYCEGQVSKLIVSLKKARGNYITRLEEYLNEIYESYFGDSSLILHEENKEC